MAPNPRRSRRQRAQVSNRSSSPTRSSMQRKAMHASSSCPQDSCPTVHPSHSNQFALLAMSVENHDEEPNPTANPSDVLPPTHVPAPALRDKGKSVVSESSGLAGRSSSGPSIRSSSVSRPNRPPSKANTSVSLSKPNTSVNTSTAEHTSHVHISSSAIPNSNPSTTPSQRTSPVLPQSDSEIANQQNSIVRTQSFVVPRSPNLSLRNIPMNSTDDRCIKPPDISASSSSMLMGSSGPLHADPLNGDMEE